MTKIEFRISECMEYTKYSSKKTIYEGLAWSYKC